LQAENDEMRNQLKGYNEDEESENSEGVESPTGTPTPLKEKRKKKEKEKALSTEAVLEAIMAEAEADVTQQVTTLLCSIWDHGRPVHKSTAESV
jgi:hypothetical protein